LKAIAIVSGGLDSVVMAHLLKQRYGYELHVLSFDYGQRHVRELDFARRTALRFNVSWDRIDLREAGVTRLMRGSALTDEVEVPEGHYAAESMKLTIVPNRNSIMLAIAFAAAVSEDVNIVAIAVHAGDHPIYPDCRPAFIHAFEAAERYANDRPSLHIYAPFIDKTKADIVRYGAELGVAFEETWSCYRGGVIHCGACGTCYERREAFKLAGVTDPTIYEAKPEFEAPRADTNMAANLERIRAKHERSGGPDEQELADIGRSS
jgi:7-cyano-7-deazaguanine synthase